MSLPIDEGLHLAALSIMRHLDLVPEKPKVRVTEAQRKKRIAQAKDIPDQAMIDLIKGLQSIPKVYRDYPRGLTWYADKARWVTFNELCNVWSDIPPKVIQAKARRLILKGVIEGCWCGCRGDFHILENGRQIEWLTMPATSHQK
jgi:hypothetical protein